MVNYLNLTNNPQINHEAYFEVIRDFRKGGLSPTNYSSFIALVNKLPPIHKRTFHDFNAFSTLNLSDISENEMQIVQKEVIRRGINKSKKCWHPEASPSTCDTDSRGKIKVTKAHSVQNNGVLSEIAEKGHVSTYLLEKADFDEKEVGKNLASIFWGFCNTHDSIFYPIETQPYTKSAEQNFLFAYRGFVVSSHKKVEVSTWMNYGPQSERDIEENKKIFDDAIINQNYSIIETEVIELPHAYPIAVSTSFYLDYDFEGNLIPHSENRMEDLFITFFSKKDVNKSYLLLSYFQEDKHLYGNLGSQLRSRNRLHSDITMLLAAHTENIYFNPSYYKSYIEQHKNALKEVVTESQFDSASYDENGNIQTTSLTPNSYLNNPRNLNFFHK